jgi:LemA protein
MDTITIVLLVLLFIVLLSINYVISTYNRLIKTRNIAQDQWAQVDVHIKRRADLIPNIVETVKGYASHEKGTLEAVITARNKAVSSATPEGEMAANGELTQALGRLFALAEAYPDLKANVGFVELQGSLKETEDKIAMARQFYNDTVLALKTAIETFPANIIAGMFGFKAMPFFEATDAEKVVPTVKF